MKDNSKVLLAFVGLSLLLSGCGVNQIGQHSSSQKEQTESIQSTVQDSLKVQTNLTDASVNNINQKITNDEFYVLAYAENEHLSLDKMFSGSKTWNFPSASIDNPNYAFCNENGYRCIADSSGSNEGETRLIRVNSQNVIIAHLESSTPKQDHAEFTYHNLVFSKQALTKKFLTSKDKIDELSEIAKNMNKNSSQATQDLNRDDSSSSSDHSQNEVDTKNLTAQQVNEWAYQAVLKICYDQNNDKPPMNSFDFEQSKDDSGCVEVMVHENHDSDWMKRHNAMSGVHPTIAIFRIDAQGNLQQNNGGDWKDTNFPYPGN